jgi:hypothetical protein
MGALHKNDINGALTNWKDSPLIKFLTVQGEFCKIIGVDLVLWLDGESEELETLMIRPVN